MQQRQRAAIRSLRCRIVPPWALERLSVGYEEIKRRIDASLEAVLNRDQVPPMFVHGEWGVGKTHLLSYVQASASALGVPCAKLDLDATSLPLNYPQRIYAALAATIQYEGDAGLQAVVTRLLLADQSRAALTSFADSNEAGDLWWPILQLCRCANENPELLFEEQFAWTTLLGLDLSWANYPYKRRAALLRLKSLASMFAAVGYGGLVILFDEAETIDQLWNVRSRGTAYTTIGAVCDAPALWSVFSITQRFQRTVGADIDRFALGALSLEPAGEWFLSNWLQRHFKIIGPPPLDDGLGPEIAMRVAGLYAEAYGVKLGIESIHKCIREWGRNPLRNPRRLIRIIVETLDQERPLSNTTQVA